MKMSKFDDWIKTLTIYEKRNLLCDYYEDCMVCPLRDTNCAIDERPNAIKFFIDEEKKEGDEDED